MPILERKIVHDMATVCSHISYPRFVLPLHKHVEYEIMLFTRGSGKQFVGEGVSEYKVGDIALIGSNSCFRIRAKKDDCCLNWSLPDLSWDEMRLILYRYYSLVKNEGTIYLYITKNEIQKAISRTKRQHCGITNWQQMVGT